MYRTNQSLATVGTDSINCSRQWLGWLYPIAITLLLVAPVSFAKKNIEVEGPDQESQYQPEETTTSHW